MSVCAIASCVIVWCSSPPSFFPPSDFGLTRPRAEMRRSRCGTGVASTRALFPCIVIFTRTFSSSRDTFFCGFTECITEAELSWTFKVSLANHPHPSFPRGTFAGARLNSASASRDANSKRYDRVCPVSYHLSSHRFDAQSQFCNERLADAFLRSSDSHRCSATQASRAALACCARRYSPPCFNGPTRVHIAPFVRLASWKYGRRRGVRHLRVWRPPLLNAF